MNEQVANEIAVLEEQIRIFTADQGKTEKEGTKKALQDEIDNARKKIEQKRQQIEAVEGDVQATQTAISDAFNMISVDGVNYSLRDFTINEAFAQVLYAWFQEKAGEIAQQYSAQIQSYKQENDELKEIAKEKDATIASLRSENDRLDLLGADLQAKRDAAGNEIIELQETIKRLNDDIRTLRENVSAPKATNLNSNIGDLMKAALASRPAIYNLRWKDDRKRNTYLATSAETGTEIEFNHLELGKYRQIEENEILQFRNQAKVEPVEVDAYENVPLVPEVITPPPFQTMAEIGSSIGNVSLPEVVEEARTVEERITELEKRIDKLERSQIIYV